MGRYNDHGEIIRLNLKKVAFCATFFVLWSFVR